MQRPRLRRRGAKKSGAKKGKRRSQHQDDILLRSHDDDEQEEYNAYIDSESQHSDTKRSGFDRLSPAPGETMRMIGGDGIMSKTDLKKPPPLDNEDLSDQSRAMDYFAIREQQQKTPKTLRGNHFFTNFTTPIRDAEQPKLQRNSSQRIFLGHEDSNNDRSEYYQSNQMNLHLINHNPMLDERIRQSALNATGQTTNRQQLFHQPQSIISDKQSNPGFSRGIMDHSIDTSAGLNFDRTMREEERLQ